MDTVLYFTASTVLLTLFTITKQKMNVEQISNSIFHVFFNCCGWSISLFYSVSLVVYGLTGELVFELTYIYVRISIVIGGLALFTISIVQIYKYVLKKDLILSEDLKDS